MSLSASELAAVVAELTPLVGSRVDTVRVHAERALTLDLYGRAGPARLLVSAEPDLTRLHAVLRRPPAPASPFPFQVLLRRELSGASLAGLSVQPGDRVVELAFARGGEGAAPLRLVAELTGRHGNLVLVGEDGLVLASAGPNLSPRRDLVRGRPYLPPAQPAAAGAGGSTGGLEGAPGQRFPLSAAIERRYEDLERERAALAGRRRLREPVRAGIARARRALEKLAAEEARVPAAERDRRLADLLKANLHLLRRGARSATLTEWTEAGPREVTVVLDPALAPRENMERHYRRYRRIVDSAGRVAARAEEVRQREAALLALLARIDAAFLEDLPRLEREARRLGAPPRPPPSRRARGDEEAPAYRRFVSAAGIPLLVGRSAERNDELTLRVARGNDLWVHARGRKGAHVVARVEKGRPPDGETLLDAAHLAAHFSEARGEPQVEVVATRAKYVRKPKGSAPGAVTYSQERTILLRVEPPRLERLLASEET